MNRRIELWLVTVLLLLAAGLRVWALEDLPPGFNDRELTYIHITEMVRDGDVAVYYQDGAGDGHAAMYGIVNGVLSTFTGDGLIGYRLLPVFSGLMTLALLYALARRLFGVPAALVALAMASVNLHLIFLSRTATAPALVPAYVLLTVFVLTLAFNLRREIEFHSPGTLVFALLAFLLGSSGYLHYSGLVLGPVTVLFIIHLIVTHQPISRRVWSSGVFVVVLATITGAPYLISTLRDTSLSEPYIVVTARPDNVRDLVDSVLQTIGGVIWRGDELVTNNVAESPLLGPLVALLMLVGLSEALRHWREPRYYLLLLLVASGFLTDVWVETGPTFSANLVAFPALLILAAVGTMTVANSLRVRGMRAVWQPVTVVVMIGMAVNVLVVRDRLFNDWRTDLQVQTAYHTRVARIAAYLDSTPGGLPVSYCTSRLNIAGPSGMTPRQTLDAMMHRESLEMRHSDCRGGLVLINAGAPMRFIFGSQHDIKSMPPELSAWISDGETVSIEGLPDGTVVTVDVEQRLRDSGGQWDALSPVYFMPDETSIGEQAPLPVPLGENLTFAGYDPRPLAMPHEAGGPPIVVVTYWRVDGEIPENLGIFAHLLAYPDSESNGAARIPLLEPWAEANSIDVLPDELEPRDFFIQVSYLWLAKNLRPADYALTVGAYVDTVTVLENHLPVLDVAREYAMHGDRVLLGDVAVQLEPVEQPDDDQSEQSDN